MPSSSSVRTFIVDDHSAIREGLRAVLKHIDGLAVSGEASSGEEALKLISNTGTDVALVDISMGGMNGIELTRRLRETNPSLQILIVSVHDETHYVRIALEAGASGYLLKDHIHSELSNAIRAVMDEGTYLSETMKEKIDR